MNDYWLMVILGAVTTWRISRMLIYEKGPFDIFERVRTRLGVVYQDGHLVRYKYEITICMWCLSVWIGALVTAVVLLLGAHAMWLLLPYVFSAFASLMNRWVDE